MKRRPQWDDSTGDRSQYRLTYAEQLQRKAALVSKNKEQAREELIKRQELLKMGKIPEDIKKTIAPAKKSVAKPQKTLKKSQSVISDPIPDLPTHFASLKKTSKPIIEDQLESLNKLDLAMKELEAAMLKAADSECTAVNLRPDGFRDDTISEASLFGLSDDDELGFSRFSEKKPDFPQSEIEKYLKVTEKNLGKNDEIIQYENVWYEKDCNFSNDEPKEYDLLKMIEETRKDLNTMNLCSEEPIAKENFPVKVQVDYDPDVIPQKFCLKPLEKPEIPRSGANSLSIFDHMKSVKIDCRKFIL